MKITNKNGTFYATPFGLAKELIEYAAKKEIDDTDQTEHFYFENAVDEVYLQLLSHLRLQHVRANVSTFQDAFTFLEAKMEAARKTVSFWDAYQIKGVLNSAETDVLQAKLAQLPSNSSIVANTSGDWNYNGITDSFFPGDIFVKDYYNRIVRIPVISSGFYYPSEIERTDGSYVFSYTYASEEPEIESNTTPVGSVAGDKALKMSFTGINSVEGKTYNESGTLNPDASATFSAISGIYPVVKVYNNSGELVFNGHSLQLSQGQYTITNETSFALTYTVR